MSRAFTSTSFIEVDPVNVVPIDEGPMTIMALVKITGNASADEWIVQAYNASNNPSWGMLASGGKFYNEGNFGPGNGATVLNAWMWVGFTKIKGFVAPRWHFKNLTAATAWSHVNDNATGVSDGSGPPVKIVIGGRLGHTSSWQGNIAAIAVWNRVLSDTEIEAASVSGLTLNRAHPQWGVLLDQSATTTDVVDLSNYGATQSSTGGTTVSSDEPPGWDYTIGSLPQTMFGRSLPESADTSDDNNPLTLGTLFAPIVDGVVTHAKILIPATNHQVAKAPNYKFALFSGDGTTLLAQRTFAPNDWDNGNWADFPFTTPVPVTAGVTYMIAYFTPDRYTATPQYPFPITVGDLSAPSTAGRFYSDPDLAFPNNAFNGNNYFADLVFFADTESVPPTGPTLKVWNGTAELSATISVWNGTAEVAASLSSIV